MAPPEFLESRCDLLCGRAQRLAVAKELGRLCADHCVGAGMPLLNAWTRLVAAFAEEVARDPARRAARLERPPMVANAQDNDKWHEADLRYRQALRQLETEVREASAGSDAAWRAAARTLYSPLTIIAVIECVVVYCVLQALGWLDGVERGLWAVLEVGRNWLKG